jgi:plastocyanin
MPAYSTATENRRASYLAAGLLSLGLVAGAGLVTAAQIAATVTDQEGRPLADAVVVAVALQGAAPAAQPSAREIVDQIGQEFVPHVKPILVGSAVFFPNRDNVRHQVYSFSPAKRFELPLYSGTPAKPIVFDKPGVVVLGCNIHDWMIGYIYVSESPYFAKTGADGKAQLNDLPARRYQVRAWHPRLQGPEPTTQPVELDADTHAALFWKLVLKPEIRIRRAPVPGSHRHY